MSNVVDAMALWEAWIELCLSNDRTEEEEKAYESIEKLRQEIGSYQLRETFYALTCFINSAWLDLADFEQDLVRKYHQLHAWDWEYLPFILNQCAMLKSLEDITVNDIKVMNNELLKEATSTKAA